MINKKIINEKKRHCKLRGTKQFATLAMTVKKQYAGADFTANHEFFYGKYKIFLQNKFICYIFAHINQLIYMRMT
jgi:hypothetical protein